MAGKLVLDRSTILLRSRVSCEMQIGGESETKVNILYNSFLYSSSKVCKMSSPRYTSTITATLVLHQKLSKQPREIS